MSDYEKIVEGLYQVNGNVNVFILDDGLNGVTIIDAGMPRSVNKIIDAVKAIGRTVGDVKHILITHADMDHIGSLAQLVEATHATVVSGEETKHYIEKRQAPPHLPIFMKPVVMLVNKLLLGQVTVGQVVSDGEVLPIAGGLRAVAIPGHTPDNFGFFWERHKVLFAPDLLNTRTKDTLDLTPPMITWNYPIAKDSFKQVMQYQPQYICVGHGRYIHVPAESHQVENLMAQL